MWDLKGGSEDRRGHTVEVLSIPQKFMFKCSVPNGGAVLGGQGNFRR